MKIDPHRQAGDPEATSRLDKAGKTDTSKKGAGTGSASKQDRVDVSADAKLLADAVKKAAASSDVRADVVERAKKLLESGELGKDAGTLADSLIDDMLKKKP